MKRTIFIIIFVLSLAFGFSRPAAAALEQQRSNDTSNASSVSQLAPARQPDPFANLDQIQGEMNRAFQEFRQQSGLREGAFNTRIFYEENPGVNQTKDGYVVRFDVSGFNPQDITVKVDPNSTLTVTGKASEKSKEESKNSTFSSEGYAAFMRSIALPSDADVRNMRTDREGDTLVITVPKK